MSSVRGPARAAHSVVRTRPIGAYWGRFHPPHKGHLGVIRRFRGRYRLIVVVGGAEHHDEPSNPFSGSERQQMWKAYLREAGIRGVRVVTLDDGDSEIGAVEALVRRYRPDVVLLSSERRASLDRALTEVGLRVVRFRREGTVSSTLIRRLIAAGDPGWSALTGRSVVRLVRRFNGLERIRRLYGARTTSSAG